MKLTRFVAAAALACAFGSSASAAVVYTNGNLGNAGMGHAINQGFSVSDSFTITSDAKLTGATVGLWTLMSEAAASRLTWSIGTSAFGNDRGTGNAKVANVFAGIGDSEYNINLATFRLDAQLAAGTYWLTLSAPTAGSRVYWDVSDGASESRLGPPFDDTAFAVSSHYFSLSTGRVRAAEVPEPVSLALFGLGLTGLYAARRRAPANA